MARLAGFRLEYRWADWDQSPFTAKSALCLIRVQPQPQRAEDSLDGFQGCPGLCRAAAQHHAVIGIAHQLADASRGKLAVQDV